MKEQIEIFLHNQYGKSGIKGIVEIMQLNYAARNANVIVSGTGHEITVDYQGQEIITEYLALRYIIENDEKFPDEKVDDAKRTVFDMKCEILENKQSRTDRDIFFNAEVYRIAFKIGGILLVVYHIGDRT